MLRFAQTAKAGQPCAEQGAWQSRLAQRHLTMAQQAAPQHAAGSALQMAGARLPLRSSLIRAPAAIGGWRQACCAAACCAALHKHSSGQLGKVPAQLAAPAPSVQVAGLMCSSTGQAQMPAGQAQPQLSSSAHHACSLTMLPSWCIWHVMCGAGETVQQQHAPAWLGPSWLARHSSSRLSRLPMKRQQ